MTERREGERGRREGGKEGGRKRRGKEARRKSATEEGKRAIERMGWPIRI